MKKLFRTFSAFVVAVMLVGCFAPTAPNSSQTMEQKSGTQEPQGKLKVYTSFYPMYDFAKKIGGDKADVINLVPVGAEPHDWEPDAKALADLESADLFIYNGAGMEGWVEKVLSSVHNDKLTVVEASKGVDLLKFEERDEKEVHDGDHEEEKDHVHEEEHEHEKVHEGHHHHGEFDPHVWLSIQNAKKELENIKDAFVEKDPANKDYYEANYEKYAKAFDALDEKFTSELGKLENKNIVVAHEAFGYLCRDYGLRQIGIEGVNADSEPDAGRMAEIIEFVHKNNVKTIYFEELISPKVAEAIAKETGAKTAMLNPLEGLGQEDLDKGVDYLQVMERNLETLIQGQ